MPRFLIVEEQLSEIESHHFAYQSAIANGAQKLYFDLELLANQKSKVLSIKYYGAGLQEIRPFLRSLTALSKGGEGSIASKPKRFFALACNIVANVLAIHRALRKKLTYDAVVCPTTWLPHLVMFFLLSLLEGNKIKALVLLFVQYPKRGHPTTVSFRMVKFFINLLFLVHPKTQIFAETKYAQQAWSELLGRPVNYIVHPVEMPAELAENRRLKIEDWESRGEVLEVKDTEPANSYSPPTTGARPLVFGFYGFARHEQGVDVLMRALEILKSRGELISEFRIVWPQSFQMPNSSWLEPKMFEHLKDKVHFFENALSPQEYQEQLFETDWLVLPYRVGSYQGRCSRISIEACAMGIPVIYSNGTDLEEVIANHGSGIGVPEEDAAALADALIRANHETRLFTERAEARMADARRFFSGQAFWRTILQGFQNN